MACQALWIPLYAGIQSVELTPHTTTDESSGRGGPLSNSPPQTVERTFEAMTEGVPPVAAEETRYTRDRRIPSPSSTWRS